MNYTPVSNFVCPLCIAGYAVPMPKTLIVCSSVSHGNTRQIADALSEVLDATVVSPGEVDAADLASYDLVGFGSGIYSRRFHHDLRARVDSLPPMTGKAFVFATSGLRESRLNRFAKPFVDNIENKGYEVVGGFTCRGYDTYLPFKLVGGIGKGRPNADDLASAREFAEFLKDSMA